MKNFTWCPQEAIKACLAHFPIPHSHVAIRSFGAPIVTPQCGNPALYLDFHDLDPICIRQTLKYRGNPIEGEEYIKNCMSEEHAKAIALFVTHRPDDELIVVNCEAGISRSAGTVLALRRHFGGDTENVFEAAIPNPHVAATVGRVLDRLKLGFETLGEDKPKFGWETEE